MGKVKIKSPDLLYLAQIVILAAVYFGAAKMGLSLASFQGIVTLVWPPTGVALAALLLFGYRLWPGIALGALLVNLSAGASLAAVGIALGNTLEAVAGAHLLNRVGLRYSLERPRDALSLVFLGAIVSPTISAAIGVASLGLIGAVAGADYGSVWWVWWLGDAMGALVVAPVLLTWVCQPRPALPLRQVVEAIVLLAALVIAGEFVFGGFYMSQVATYPLAYIVFPFVIWAAFRFGQRGAVTATLVAASLAIWGTAQGIGPFVQATIDASLLLLHGFISTMAITAMLLAAALAERNQAEEALKEQRAFLRQVIDINPHLIFAKDRAGRFTLANQAVADVFGTTIEEILGKTDADFNPETAQNEHFRRDDLEVMDTLQEKFIPKEYITDAAGQIRWLQTIKRPILDSNGQAHQVLGVATDITAHRQAQEELQRYKEYLEELVKERTLELTEAVKQLEREITERRQAEESLRESEERFHRLSDATFEGIVIHDQGLILDANQSFALMVGYELAEVQGKNVLEFTAPEYRDLIMQHVQSDYEKPYEVMGLKKDGSTFSAEIWAKIIPYQGRMVRVAAIRDVTERKRTEEALRTSEAQLRTIGDNLPGGVIYQYVLEPEGRHYFTYLSSGIERLSGIPAQEAIPDADKLHSLFLEEDRKRIQQTTLESAANLTLFDIEARRRLPTGEIRWSHYRSAPRRLINGATVWDGVELDITERKQAEEALRQQAAELQARNEELDAFAHTVAHDLKVPLGPITGYADILIEDDAVLTAKERQKYLQAIARSGRKMNSIIGELLLLASVRKKEVEPTPLDMAGIVAEAQQRLAHLIEQHRAEIILPQVWPVALGYAPWIEEVWANYLSNAIKYGGRPPRLELGATMVGQAKSLPYGEPQPPMIRFWVHDNGPGLSLAAQQRLFTPFTQLGQVRTEGQGLGLSIVRRIIEKLGGEVGIESEGTPGQGSIFSFTLPQAPV